MWTLEVSHVLSQELMMVTLVAPGLIAISARKYHLGKVIIGTLSVTAICYMIGWILLSIVPIGLLTHMSVDLDRYTQLSLTNPYIVLPLSLLVAILVYYRFGIRGGGYLVAPFLAAVTLALLSKQHYWQSASHSAMVPYGWRYATRSSSASSVSCLAYSAVSSL